MHLELETGQIFYGKSFGFPTSISGEIVFQTGMVGYPESLTDPSYHRQILVLTYPLIGNYGIPNEDRDEHGVLKHFESDKIQVSGLIVSEYNPQYSHWKGIKNLGDWLYESKIPAISGIDTRHLTLLIREHGSIKGRLIEQCQSPTDWINISNINIVAEVSNPLIRYYPKIKNQNQPTILVLDFGIKNSQIRSLLYRGFNLEIAPWNYYFLDKIKNYNGIFLSNGPGDPTAMTNIISQLKELIQNNHNIPIFGICLGHQILSLATGATTYKMKYGNRGHNIPSRLLDTKRCLITSQNHGYAVDVSTLNDDWMALFTNANDNSNEGIIHKRNNWFSVQFHPEAKAGPTDANFLFDLFKNVIVNPNINLLDSITHELVITPLLPYHNKINELKKVLVLGSGGLSIGQAGEFDYSGSQAIKAFKTQMQTVLINPNVATVQTSIGLADKIYSLPITPEFVRKVIELERPDCIALSFGGQTALNCGLELNKDGTLQEYNIHVLGTPISSIEATENRQLFKEKLQEIGERIAPSRTVYNLNDAYEASDILGYPVLVRSGFTLGGLGSGFATNRDELRALVEPTFSDVNAQVIIDKSLKGWKEVEYEIVRDQYDNCISVCNMENLDPLGIHTGESIVVAPSQTLTDDEYNNLRRVALKTVRHLGIIGECNIQYALDPNSEDYFIVEVNARLSRSSALASKATGYPLANVAAKIMMGYSLVDIKNSITKSTTACFEPSLDYCAIKIPRWDLKKFPQVSSKIGSSMKSVGEVMAISRSFEEALQKALRMVDENCNGLDPNHLNQLDLNLDDLANPSYFRIFLITHLLYQNKMTLQEIHNETKIDYWFLRKFQRIIDMYHLLEKHQFDKTLLIKAKKTGFSDLQIAKITQSTEIAIRNLRSEYNIKPWFKLIDTVAGEFPCYTNYCYSTYNGDQHDLEPLGDESVGVLGSGVYRIGSSVEFDWCSVNCIKELRKTKKAIMINYNPETVSTDYDEADRLYFDELSFEMVMDIYQFENPSGLILSMGGQLPNNIAMDLHRQGVKVLGTSPESIDQAENRYKFSRMLDQIEVAQPLWKESTNLNDTKEFCNQVKYPCLVRPSYVLSGASMTVVYSDEELDKSLTKSAQVSKDFPVVVSKFINDAKEIEVDAVAKDGWVELISIAEHVENAGVHSGDATLILPAQDLTEKTIKQIRKSVYKISNALQINGPFNIQFIAKDDQILVIECNLRVSRTFPFVSKTFDVNFITVATQIILGQKIKITPNQLNRIQKQQTINSKIGVKVPQFSFNRLQNADVKLGVEMVSTGEVASYGLNHHQAYLKALASSGFKLPIPHQSKHQSKILVSIGSFKFKEEFKDSIKLLTSLFDVYATYGTADYYNSHMNMNLKTINNIDVLEKIRKKEFDLIINISDANKTRQAFTNINNTSLGYQIRSTGVKFGISIMTDIKTAKLFTKAITYHLDEYYEVNQEIDCKTSYESVKIPGLIDLHVHIGDLDEHVNGTWRTETTSALHGGVSTILAMSDTNPPIDNLETLRKYQEIAEKESQVDYLLTILGTPRLANSSNIENEMNEMAKIAVGMKMFLGSSHRNSDIVLTNPSDWSKLLSKWSSDRIVFLDVGDDSIKTLMAFLFIAKKYSHHYHLCHVKSKMELEMVQEARLSGLTITTEVSPHYLYSISNTDSEYLLEHLDQIDCFVSNHSPYTNQGIDSIEWTLKMYTTAIKEGKITLETLIEKMIINPRKILKLPSMSLSRSWLEVDLDYTSQLPDKMVYGHNKNVFKNVFGFLRRMTINNQTVIIDEKKLDESYNTINLIEEYQKGHPYKTSEEILELVEVPLLDEYLPTKTFTRVPYNYRDILRVNQFDREQLRLLCLRAQELREKLKKQPILDILKGKTIATVFYEPSTRTRLSFESAAKKMGADVITLTPEHSSIKKGESMADSLRTMETYSDLIVLRSSKEGDVDEMAKIIKKPLINAGDGCGEHPTQALLDLYTIKEERGSLHNLTITFVGDLKHGRTVHSLVKLLAKYDLLRFYYVSDPELNLPKEIQQEISIINPNLEQFHVESLDDVLPRTDVLYMTRLQEERLDTTESKKTFKYPIITPSILSEAKKNLIIMHPLPRNNEISTAVDSDPRAAYFRQMEYGLYMRMALLELLMK
jgi:carbamoyl-phosphate synthase/aspartate carbamoyltransferase/dihydroorotase